MAPRGRRALTIAALMATTALVCAQAQAQQTGLKVTAGAVALTSPKAGETVITQATPKAILNWQSFSIPAGTSVVFDQLGPGSIALNRVLGSSASLINGSLTANGQVWLINPAGILFGGGGSVNVAGLIATTSDIRDQDFLSGNYAFGIPSADPSATVVNHGSIRVRHGGSAVLAAPGVANSGLIEATLGTVALGSGSAFTVDFHGDKLLSFAVSQPVNAAPTDASGHPLSALVSNSGKIAASGGQVLLTAAAARGVIDNVINMSGTVVATTAHEVDGAIVIDAGANGTAKISGTIDASGRNAGETGGTVKVLGARVALLSGASIDASGDAGGGTVLVGGNVHGAGTERHAQSVSMAQGAAIDASAITSGNGGTVALWSDGETVFDGSITTRGGAERGGGGFIETSGHALAIETGSVNALAANGPAGTWLLDPTNITIAKTGKSSFIADTTFAGDPGKSDTIAVTAIQSAGANVTLQATHDITVAAPIAMANNGVGLIFSAGNSISVQTNSAITTRGGNITFEANCCGFASGSGTILTAAPLATDGGGQTGGAVSLTVAGGVGYVALGGNITAGGGISISAPITALEANVTLNTAPGNGAVALSSISGNTHNLAISSGSGAISLGGVTTSGSLTLTTSGSVTQSQRIAAASLALSGGGTITLTQSDNSIASIAGAAGTLDLTDSVALSIAGASGLKLGGNLAVTDTASGGVTVNGAVTAGGTATIAATNGAITIASGATLTASGAGDALVFEAGAGSAAGVTAGGDFVNNAGAGALSTPNGNWLVYTGDLNTGGTTVGGVAPYTERYDTASGFAPAGGGNFIFYRAAPVLTIAASNQTMTYGGAVPTLTFTASGEVNGDTPAAALAGAPSLATTAAVTSDVGAYTITAANGTIANPLNYTLSFLSGSVTVTPATLTVTPNAATATYNAVALNNAAYSDTLANYAITGLVNGQTLGAAGVTLSGALAFNGSTATAVRNAGTYSQGQGSLTLASDHGDYVMGFANPLSNAYVINPLAVVLTGSRIYDATATAAAGILTVGNNLDGANLTLSGSATLTGKDVGTNGFVSGLGLALGGSAAGNYTLAGVAANGSAVTITPATLTIAPDAGQFKIYGTNDPALAYLATGFQGADSTALLTGALTRNGYGTLPGEQVGSYAITNGNLSAGGNYTVALTAQTFAITPATLTIAANAQGKTYGVSDPALTFAANGFVNGAVDGVALNDTAGTVLTGGLARAGFGTLAGEQVGTYAIGQGTLAANADYAIAYTGANLAITPATLTVAANAQGKTYGVNDPALTFAANGFVNGTVDGVALNDTAGTVLTGGLERASFATLAGEQVGNYAIGQGTLAANTNYAIAYTGANLAITPATLTVAANAQGKSYGVNDPALTFAANGFVNGTVDGVALNDNAGTVLRGGLARAGFGTLAGEQVGTYAIGQGTLAANADYAIAYTGANLAITPAALTIAANAQGKTYGVNDPALTFAANGFVNGTVDGVALNDTAGTVLTGGLARSGFGTLAGEQVGTYAIGQGTLAANTNYAISYTGANLAITPATLTIAANGQGKTYGVNDPALTFAANGFVNSTVDGVALNDTAGTVLTGGLARASFGTLPGEQVGTYAIGQGTLAANADYAISYTGANLAITSATLSVAANAQGKTYGVNDPALTFAANGFVNGTVDGVALNDTAGTVLTGGLARSGFGTLAGEQVGTYAIGQGTLAANTNYAIAYTGANLAITPATLTVAANAQGKTYGVNDPALTFNASGFVNGIVDGVALNDTAGTVLTGALTRVAGETVLGGPYAITQGTLAATANYTISYTGNTLTIDPLAVVLAGTRTYDGTAAAAAGFLTVSNNLDGTNLTLSGSGTLAGKDVGANGFVAGATLALGGSAAGNYTLAGITANGSAVTITPASLTLAATSDTKVYDGTTLSTALPGALGLMGGDSVTGLAQAFQSKDVMGVGGSTLAVTAGYSVNDGVGGADYTVTSQTAPGTITPATLTYIANPAVAPVGNGSLTLSGGVTGFVANDTLANSTTGALAFATPATAASPAGQYPIDGTGLLATNYIFVEAPPNAVALTIGPTTQLHTFAVTAALAALPPPPPPLLPPAGGNAQGATTNAAPVFTPPPGNGAANAAALNDIAPTAGGPGATTGDAGPAQDTQTDNATTMMFQSMGGHAEPAPGGTGKTTQPVTAGGFVNRIFVNGLLVVGPPPAGALGAPTTDNGVPAGDVEFSNWGNEAFWQ